MNARSLHASINQIQVGTVQEVGGLWSFQYAAEWLNSPVGFALSPHLPLSATPLLDGATLRPVQWYFDNLLPEEGQRTLLAKDARLNAAWRTWRNWRMPAAVQPWRAQGCSVG